MIDMNSPFVKMIRQNPDDEDTRLVFADWCDENGEQETAAQLRAGKTPFLLVKGNRDEFAKSVIAQDDDEDYSESGYVIVRIGDAAEAFCGDVVKPLKIMLTEYGEIERRIEAVIAEKFDVRFGMDEVREIDHGMLIAERRAMFSKDGVEWAGEDKVRKVNVWFQKWTPRQAESQFTKMARHLGIKVDL